MNDEALTDDQIGLLRALAEPQRAVAKGGHKDFMTSSAFEGVSVVAVDGTNHALDTTDLDELESRGFVKITNHRAHGDVNGYVTKEGFAFLNGQPRIGSPGSGTLASARHATRLDALQRFDVGERVGLGVHGQVFAGSDPQLGNRRVALKFLNPSTEVSLGTAAQAAALAKVDHINVVPVLALGRAQHPSTGIEAACIVMPFIDSATPLEDLLGAGAIPTTDAVRFSKEILDGLGAIHERGLPHGDLHDGNVMIDAHGRVRIIDIHYIEAVAEGSTATKASVVRRDCEQAAMLIFSLLNKGGIAFEKVGEFQREARRASELNGVRRALDAVVAAPSAAGSSAEASTQGSTPASTAVPRLQELHRNMRLPAFRMTDTGSKRHDDKRVMDYRMSLQQLDQVPILEATVVTPTGTFALGNLPVRREDTFGLPMEFGNESNASHDVAVRVQLNSGETLEYRFNVTGTWNGSSRSTRTGVRLLQGKNVVESIDD